MQEDYVVIGGALDLELSARVADVHPNLRHRIRASGTTATRRRVLTAA